ncbi:MAG: hypothetical protein ACRD19_07035 [Terriglobia bacterium]
MFQQLDIIAVSSLWRGRLASPLYQPDCRADLTALLLAAPFLLINSGSLAAALQTETAPICAQKRVTNRTKIDSCRNHFSFAELLSGSVENFGISFSFILIKRFVRILESGWFRLVPV